MTKRRDPEPKPPDEIEDAEEFDPYAAPDELGEPASSPAREKRGRTSQGGATGDVELDFGLGSAPQPPRRSIPRAAIIVAVVVVVAIALFTYRAVSRKKALRTAIGQAETDVRYDTADGYRKAAAILAPFAGQDPVEAAGLRAFALGMLALDYREAAGGDEAETLLVKPERADPIPRWASLARAALALSKGEAGTAMTAASRVPGDPVAGMLEGRIALAAGNLEAALEPLHAAAAAEPALPAALAVHGDAVRRAKRDARAAQAAYTRALASAGEHVHARAAFGLAKLALTGHLPPADATGPLERLAADATTPPNERARAALHAAALALRAGDRARATSLLDGAGLDPRARAWAELAAGLEAATGRIYHAVEGAPAPLLSASDDDPPELAAIAVEPPPPAPAPKAAPAKAGKPPTKAAAPKKKAAAPKKGVRKPIRR